VTSDLEQIGEILKKYQAGILVKPGNARDLVKGLIKATQIKQPGKKMAQRAYIAAKNNFTWKINAKRTLAEMEKLNIRFVGDK